MALSPERISPAFSLRFTSKRTLSSPGPHCPPARQRPGCRPCPDVCSPGACAFSGLPESSARPPGGDGTGGACQVQAFRETQQDAADTPSTSQGSPGRPPPFLEHGSGLESELGGVCVKQEHSRGASSVSPRMLTGHLGFSQAASGTRVTLCSRPTPRLPMVSNQSLTPTPRPRSWEQGPGGARLHPWAALRAGPLQGPHPAWPLPQTSLHRRPRPSCAGVREPEGGAGPRLGTCPPGAAVWTE